MREGKIVGRRNRVIAVNKTYSIKEGKIRSSTSIYGSAISGASILAEDWEIVK